MTRFQTLWTFLPLVLLGIVLTAAPLHAQERDDASQAPLIREGRKALSFSFDGLDLGYFEGGVGGKYWLAPRIALRASVSGDLDFSEDEDEGGNSEGSQLGAGLRAGVERHFGDWRRVSPFVGFVAGANASRSQRELRRIGGNDGPRRVEEESTRLSAAADVVLGVEYFLAPHVSLAGEYAVGGRVGRAQQEQAVFFPDGTVERSENDRTFFNFTGRSPTLVLSIYF